MDICYSRGFIAGDHIHTDKSTCNIGEPLLKYRLGMVSNILLGRELGAGGGLERVQLDLNPRPFLLQWFEIFGPLEGLFFFYLKLISVQFRLLRTFFSNLKFKLTLTNDSR